MSMFEPHEEGEGRAEDGFDTALARFVLHLRSRGMMDSALLNAFEATPRMAFMPNFKPDQLYSGIHLPLPCGEEALDPATLARHLVLLRLEPGMRVLDIGTGSGFLAGLMARLGAQVTSLERHKTLLENAQKALSSLGIEGVTLRQADGLARLEDLGGFDRLVLNGAVDGLPNHVLDRLKDGGMALGARKRAMEARLVIWQRKPGKITETSEHGSSRLPPMREGVPLVL